jgi:predicted transcriptional regulator
MRTSDQHPGVTTQAILESLQRAVEQELERKRRLGHYYVTSENGKIVFHGEDAPTNETAKD